MSKSKPIAVPVLEDIVVLGKDVTEIHTLPPVLNALQVQALRQQIETILQSQLDARLQQASQQVVTELKAYLDKELPKLIEAAKRAV
jgi:hypothetical protein